MRSERRLRRLVVGEGDEWRWTVRHRHTGGGPCREVLTLHRDGVAVRVVFRDGPGRVVGAGFHAHSGLVVDEQGRSVSLHEPGVVRAFVDEVRQRGLAAGEVDGWELLPAVVVRRAAGATPGVPPGCPPGP
ncbi:hypothetical protein [Streptomyces cellostaticus]|uniref:hypothetical protein n=1 Tax=Streptomyces cellostaticus TaxID=67285 RepID=UPI00099F09AA|nr:hypothetical protein [Streptomyces cellostaticus]